MNIDLAGELVSPFRRIAPQEYTRFRFFDNKSLGTVALACLAVSGKALGAYPSDIVHCVNSAPHSSNSESSSFEPLRSLKLSQLRLHWPFLWKRTKPGSPVNIGTHIDGEVANIGHGQISQSITCRLGVPRLVWPEDVRVYHRIWCRRSWDLISHRVAL
jgi:hypothetical protein